MLDRTLIYATDFNPVVIEEAKNALYGMKEYKKAEENYQELENSQKFADYFIFYDSFVEVKPALKKKIMFFVHNLQNSSSFNEFDLIECRNVLIYFKIAFQEKIFKLLYDSLKFGGYLFLGLNEFIVPSYEYKFEVYDSKYKIFKKVR
jgi:chemotaxis protein methyltransferase CheR